MQDNFGRQITYARISITDLCNLRCRYCMPQEGVCKKDHGDILSIEQLIAVSDALADLGVSKQRITGGEPLVRRGVKDLMERIGRNDKVRTLAITTNGTYLADNTEWILKCGVSAINVSIDTLDKDKFHSLTRGGNLDDVLRGIESVLNADITVKLNAVLLKDVNTDEIKRFADFAKGLGVEARFIELMPFSHQQSFAKEHFIDTKSVAEMLDLQKCADDDSDKVQRYAFADGTKIGFISPISNKFCSACNRVRITADGKLLNCLHQAKEYDLKPYLDNAEELKKYVLQCVCNKPKEHHILDGELQSRPMEIIGG